MTSRSANNPDSRELDPANIQGLLKSGYKHLRQSRFILFHIRADAPDGHVARWLRDLRITNAAGKTDRDAINIAFTPSGLRACGVSAGDLDSFPQAFVEGMVTEHRQRLLGDHSASSPKAWRWGGNQKSLEAIHGVLCCYAVDPTSLAALTAEVTRGPIEVVEPELEPGEWLAKDKEHFGFRDGIGQPEVAGLHKHRPWRRPIATGEFVLGYRNEYGELPRSPVVAGNDFGRDGSYLVMRQLQQHVGRFWEFVGRKAEEMNLAARFPGVDPVMLLAAKMVGRWPGGAPLALSPHRDDPDLAEEDVFDYGTDVDGVSCPFGSHVRRSNPRNWFLGSTPSESLQVASRHRILRRGRAYGDPLDPMMDPRALARRRDDNVERGLYFLCLNTNIERQFEVVQHNWLNNPKFGGLYGGADPTVGDHNPDNKAATLPRELIIPADPVRSRLLDLQRFVTVLGGAYFFLPSLRAIETLAALAE